MNQDFVEILSILNTHEVQFMIVGSYATAYHGQDRLDIIKLRERR